MMNFQKIANLVPPFSDGMGQIGSDFIEPSWLWIYRHRYCLFFLDNRIWNFSYWNIVKLFNLFPCSYLNLGINVLVYVQEIYLTQMDEKISNNFLTTWRQLFIFFSFTWQVLLIWLTTSYESSQIIKLRIINSLLTLLRLSMLYVQLRCWMP